MNWDAVAISSSFFPLLLYAWERGRAKGDLTVGLPKELRPVGQRRFRALFLRVRLAFRLGRVFIDTLADVQADSACQRADVAFPESTVM
jgi:hypothetical protein